MSNSFPELKFVKLQVQDNIALVTISRPEALNALNQALLADLSTAFNWISEQALSGLRAVILTGEGTKSFVAGADIKEMHQLSIEQAEEFARHGQQVFSRIENLQVPVIAAVNGFALGGGLELALSCDFIVMSENAKVGLPEVGLGLIPGFGGTVRLSKVVGLPMAKKMIYSAEVIPATEALSRGICVQVVPQTELLETCQKLAKEIGSKSPLSVSHAKRSIAQAWDLDQESGLQNEAKEFSRLFSSQDMKEGTTAFIEKRKPEFKGQ